MNEQLNAGFRPWKAPSRLMVAVAKRLLPSKLFAEELPVHTRTRTPVLTDGYINWVVEWALLWAHKEVQARQDYVEQIKSDPDRGNLYHQAYRQRVEQAEQHYRQRVMELVHWASHLNDYAVSPEELMALFEYATNFKNWVVRYHFPDKVVTSLVVVERSKWFFLEFLMTWEIHRDPPESSH